MSFALTPDDDQKMHPSYPPMDDEGTQLQTTQEVQLPQPEELDELFTDEHRQMLALGGLRWAESVVLQQIEPYDVAPNNRTWNAHDSVRVDEGRWLGLFRRDRWMSYDAEILPGGGKKWDVDDDVVWGTISRVIEVANRIVRVALGHEW